MDNPEIAWNDVNHMYFIAISSYPDNAYDRFRALKSKTKTLRTIP